MRFSGPCRLARVLAPALALAALLGAGAACGRDEVQQERLGRAVLSGKVRLTANAELPAFAPFDLSRAPLVAEAMPPPPAGCAAANARARYPVQRTPDGLLTGIVVTASDFSGVVLGTRIKPRRHALAIRGCALYPPLIAARTGDWLELHNADAVPFAPEIGPTTRENPLAPGQRVRVPLPGGRVTSVSCPPSRPCGRSDVVVFQHPLFAVTDAHGAFRIDGFPHGEMVRVTAWHPLFEPSETFVWLEPGQHGTVELRMTPKASFTAGGAASK